MNTILRLFLCLGLFSFVLQAQGAFNLPSVLPVVSDSTCSINCQDPGYRLMTQVLDGETITREYIIHVPSGYQEGDNLPLVIAYHGFGGCAYYMQEEAGNGALNDLADEEGFFVAYPQAAYRPAKEDVYWEPGFNGGESIYQDDIYFTEQMMGHIHDEFSVDLSSVYAAGYSNGGMLTYSLACLRGDLFAACGVMSGALLDDMATCNPANPVPLIIFHGTGDFVLPYNGGQYYTPVQDVVGQWLVHNQIPASSLISTELNGGNVVHENYQGGADNTCLSFYTVEEEYGSPGDHVWFSQDMDGISPTRIMWEFFSEGCGTVSGTPPEMETGVVVFPVPFDDQFVLGNQSLALAHYAMFDVQGTLVHQGRVGADGSIVGLGGLTPGFYILNAGGQTFKLVK